MIGLLRPAGVVERPDSSDRYGRLYVRSYLVLRILIGLLALALPVLLVVIDGVWFDNEPSVRNSLSAYYYSGGGALFVGALCATGIFLVTYKVVEGNLDNTLSFAAGFAAVLVALFPTGPPVGWEGPTQLQEHLGEGVVQWIHYGAALVFLASLAGISYLFGNREEERPPGRPQRRSRRFWRAYHRVCAVVIGLAVLSVLVALALDRRLLWGEIVAVWAFGASWLMKGLELNYLRGD